MRSHWRELARMMRMEIPAELVSAFDFLESEGLRFCVDFGIENARDKAWARLLRYTIH